MKPPKDLPGLMAFVVAATFVGGNFVAIRFSNMELDPFWGASVRFVPAALVFLLLVVVRRIPLPTGRALFGPLWFGLLGVGAFFAFAYWGLLTATAATGAIILSGVPLITMLLAWAHGIEPFRWRRLVGALLVVAGIAILATAQDTNEQRLNALSVLALVAAAFCLSESSVLLKRFPAVSPMATNAVGFTAGALVLIVLSLATGEEWRAPTQWPTWTALAYLTVFGSVVLFFLLVTLIQRWGPSSTVYIMVASPLVAMGAGYLLAREPVTWVIILSGTFVVAGVAIGVLNKGDRGSTDQTGSIQKTQ